MESIALVFIIIGIVLLIAEIFVPSFGITGIFGIMAIIVGVIFTADTFFGGMILFTIILALAILLMFIAYKVFAKKGSPLILEESLKDDLSNVSLEFFVQKEGVAVTPLRPAGSADIDGVRLDVLTRGEFIEKGSPIKVTSIQGKTIVVAKK